MHNPGTEHWEAIERLIGYIQRKDNHELVIRIPIEIFRDSSYADCEDTQRNITGDIHTIGGRLVSWQAQKTKFICLSSVKAEYIEMTEISKQQIFILMVLEEPFGMNM